MNDVARKERLAFAIRAAMAAAGETNDTLAAKLGKSVTTCRAMGAGGYRAERAGAAAYNAWMADAAIGYWSEWTSSINC